MKITMKVSEKCFPKLTRFAGISPFGLMQFLIFAFSLGLFGCSVFSKGNKNEIPASKAFIFKIQQNEHTNFGFYICADTTSTLENIKKEKVGCFLECDNENFVLRQSRIQCEMDNIPLLPMHYFILETTEGFKESNCKSIVFEANNEKFQFPFEVGEQQGDLFVYPYVFKVLDSLILFGMDIVRTNRSGDEYFSTSERLRVEIQNELGKTVWRSDEGVYFLQVIGEVEPKEIGSCYRYVIFWNRTDRNGRFITKGKFNVFITLPIQPKPITKFIDINLGE